MNTIDPKFLARKLAGEKKLKPPRIKYNMKDPMQRKKAWINSVCYFCYLEKGRNVADALRVQMTKPYVEPSIRKIASEIWSRKKQLEKLIERNINDKLKQRTKQVRQNKRHRG